MGKKENAPKQTIIEIEGKEYIYESFNEQQKLYIDHMNDLTRKIQSMEFNIDQLSVGREAFMQKLKATLN